MKKLAEQFGITLDDEQVRQFATYEALLLAWNAKLNLTRIVEPKAIRIRHFLDGLTCALAMGDLSGRTGIDVGTGAGFPGIPLKILYPEMTLTLTDSVAKKTTFLEVVVGELELEDVTVLAERAEALGRDPAHREQYDWAVARAVAQLPTLAEYLLPLVQVGGHMLAQKGETAANELTSAKNSIEILGGAGGEMTAVQLPDHERIHYLVKIKKVKQLPEKYPRRVGVALKRPL